jgi:hypothetical protein
MKEYIKNGTKHKIWEQEKVLRDQAVTDQGVVDKNVKTYWEEVNGSKYSITEREYNIRLKNVVEETKKETPKKKTSGKSKKK